MKGFRIISTSHQAVEELLSSLINVILVGAQFMDSENIARDETIDHTSWMCAGWRDIEVEVKWLFEESGGEGPCV